MYTRKILILLIHVVAVPMANSHSINLLVMSKLTYMSIQHLTFSFFTFGINMNNSPLKIQTKDVCMDTNFISYVNINYKLRKAMYYLTLMIICYIHVNK